MDDLITYEPESGNMVIAIGSRVETLLHQSNPEVSLFVRHDLESGSILDEKILPGPGWQQVHNDGQHAVMGNFFNGQMVNLNWHQVK